MVGIPGYLHPIFSLKSFFNRTIFSDIFLASSRVSANNDQATGSGIVGRAAAGRGIACHGKEIERKCGCLKARDVEVTGEMSLPLFAQSKEIHAELKDRPHKAYPVFFLEKWYKQSLVTPPQPCQC